jgi:hypothetical protein
MPHKFFGLHAIRTYAHRTLAKVLHIKHKQINKLDINAWIHTKIIINIYMQHIQEMPINIPIVINHTQDKPIKIIT